MDLTGKVVSLRLTADGIGAVGEVPSQVFIMDSDEAGIWILLDDVYTEGSSVSFPVRLVKWNFVAALSLDYKLPRSHAQRSGIGFLPFRAES